MSYGTRITLPVVANALGVVDVLTQPVTGVISHIVYVRSTLATGADFTITVAETGETLWAELNVAASTIRAPRQPVHDVNGAPLLYATNGTAQTAPILIVNSPIRVQIAAGGNGGAGTFYFLFG